MMAVYRFIIILFSYPIIAIRAGIQGVLFRIILLIKHVDWFTRLVAQIWLAERAQLALISLTMHFEAVLDHPGIAVVDPYMVVLRDMSDLTQGSLTIPQDIDHLASMFISPEK